MVAAAMSGIVAVTACAQSRGDQPGDGAGASTTLELVRPTTTVESGPATSAPTTAEALGDRQGVLVAAGDISCAPGQEATRATCQMAATAELAASLDPDVVTPLGDLQYERGEADGFRRSYDLTWGRLKAKTRPAPGNHEYVGGVAPGYFGYFGATAGKSSEGWYSYEVGSWHVIALNSNCRSVGGCDAGSPQMRWLAADLAAHPAQCSLAYWHHPRYSSGLHGPDSGYDALWKVLDEAGVDVALGGHDHHYERFAPQAAGAVADPDGIRQFVVGTGGRSLYPVLGPDANSEAYNAATFGVLRLDLRAQGYAWRFAPAPPGKYSDEGSERCR